MCGRSRCSLAPERVEQVTGVQRERWVDSDRLSACCALMATLCTYQVPLHCCSRYHASYNVQPGRWTPILRLDEQQLPVLQTMKWGLVPSFTKQGETPDHFKMFNARSETVLEKPIFSRLVQQHRCVVILDGFYEWKKDAGGKKQPYYVSFGEGQVLRMAGLYDVWKDGPEGAMATYTILTVDAAPRLAWLHNRMPVLLPDDAAVSVWLTGSSTTHKQQQQEQDGGTIQEHEGSSNCEQSDAVAAAKGSAFQLVNQLCIPCNSGALQWHPVTPAMSRPSYDGPDCCQDVRTKKGNISSFFKPQGTAGSSKGTVTAGKAPAQQQQKQKPHTSVAAKAEEFHKPAQQQQQPQQAASTPSAKKGSIDSYFKLSPPLAGKAKAQQPQQPPGDMQQAVRNADEQEGPSAADEAASAAVLVKALGSCSSKRAAAEQQATITKTAKKPRSQEGESGNIVCDTQQQSV